jgi:hypothetical protein
MNWPAELKMLDSIAALYGVRLADWGPGLGTPGRLIRQKVIYIYYNSGGSLAPSTVCAAMGVIDSGIVANALEIVPERMEVFKDYRDEIEKNIAIARREF